MWSLTSPNSIYPFSQTHRIDSIVMPTHEQETDKVYGDLLKMLSGILFSESSLATKDPDVIGTLKWVVHCVFLYSCQTHVPFNWIICIECSVLAYLLSSSLSLPLPCINLSLSCVILTCLVLSCVLSSLALSCLVLTYPIKHTSPRSPLPLCLPFLTCRISILSCLPCLHKHNTGMVSAMFTLSYPTLPSLAWSCLLLVTHTKTGTVSAMWIWW